MIIVKDNLTGCPLVSIIILTYNQEKLVGQTISSVAEQKTNFPYEILLADDCSTDNTKAVCIKYQEMYPDRIVVIENDKNKGLKRNYFENISEFARGKYIAVCGGDDWWIDDCKIQKQIDYLENHPECTMVHTNSYNWKHGTDIKKAKPSKNTCRDDYEKMVVQNNIMALTVCFTKKAYDAFVREIDPLNQTLPMDDYSMWIWHSFRGKIHKMEDYTAIYRILPNSLSHSTNFLKAHHIETERREIKMYFINHFKTYDQNIIDQINLKCYLDTLSTTELVGDVELRNERNVFLLKHHYYLFFIIGKVYQIIGKNIKLNRLFRKFDLLVKMYHPCKKYFI